MIIKTRFATPAQLNYLVAEIVGFDNGDWLPDYATEHEHGDPIIEEEGIVITRCNDIYFPKGNEKGDHWEALYFAHNPRSPTGNKQYGPTPLIAAMRCFVLGRIGTEAEIPDELANEGH